jgi:hypothetical protein
MKKFIVNLAVLVALAVPAFGQSISITPAPSSGSSSQVLTTIKGYAVSVTAKNVMSGALPVGDNDVYTCPASKRCYFDGGFVTNANGAAGSVTWYLEHKIASTYYRLSTNNTLGDATYANISPLAPLVLEAAEKIAFNTTTSTGLKVFLRVFEMANTVFMKTLWVHGTTTGDNLIYTAPAGGAIGLGQVLGAGATIVAFVSDAGGTRTYKCKINDVQVVNSTTSAASSASGLGCLGYLQSGDTVKMNVDTGAAGMTLWVSVIEP